MAAKKLTWTSKRLRTLLSDETNCGMGVAKMGHCNEVGRRGSKVKLFITCQGSHEKTLGQPRRMKA